MGLQDRDYMKDQKSEQNQHNQKPTRPSLNNRFETQRPLKKTSLTFKIALGVAGGILLAGTIWTVGSIFIATAFMKSVVEVIQSRQQVTTTTKANTLINHQIQFPRIHALQPVIEAEEIRENSKNAVIQARNETAEFDKQYKKPDECYNMKDASTRMKCANEYMRAKAAFDKAQGQ